MKLITGILLTAVAASAAVAQNPTIIQNTKNSLNAAAKKAETEQNAALPATGVPSKPAAGTTAKPTPAATTSKTSTAQLKPVAAPVKTAPAPAKPAPLANKQASVQSTTQSAQAKPATKSGPTTPAANSAVKKSAPIKIAVSPVKVQPKQGEQKTGSASKAAKSEQHPAQKSTRAVAPAAAKSESPAAATPKTTRTITAEGRRDPFLSPVVSRSSGPNCSTGKRCLAIDQITVRGVVKSDAGMIAVVVNSINKAYFLKENDPVYNGYVLRITGDSVVFRETFQDRLGKESTREVVKKITTPAV